MAGTDPSGCCLVCSANFVLSPDLGQNTCAKKSHTNLTSIFNSLYFKVHWFSHFQSSHLSSVLEFLDLMAICWLALGSSSIRSSVQFLQLFCGEQITTHTLEKLLVVIQWQWKGTALTLVVGGGIDPRCSLPPKSTTMAGAWLLPRSTGPPSQSHHDQSAQIFGTVLSWFGGRLSPEINCFKSPAKPLSCWPSQQLSADIARHSCS